MIKFLHKKHINKDHGNAKIIIYYNLSDIFLGTALIILVAFFIHDYLSHSIFRYKNTSNPYMNSSGVNLTPTLLNNPKY